jgi:tetratricopeptide (TPR) repeat protein
LRDVLRDPRIGNFQVTEYLDLPCQDWRVNIFDFFSSKNRDELLLLYISGHGIKDDKGRLYFAATDTDTDRLPATGIPATFIHEVASPNRRRPVVIILDTCFSGAYTRDVLLKSPREVNFADYYGDSTGTAVIAASGAIEHALASDPADGSDQPSLFTKHLIEGLRSGEADRDEDGQVSLDDLFKHVSIEVQRETQSQRPERCYFGLNGDLVVASNPRPRPGKLPQDVIDLVRDPRPKVRELAVSELARLLSAQSRPLALAARQELERLSLDDSRIISGAAAFALQGGAILGEPQDVSRKSLRGRYYPWAYVVIASSVALSVGGTYQWFRAQQPAAPELAKPASNGPNPASQQIEALQSAELYAQASNFPMASEMLEKFLRTNPALAAAQELRERLAEYATRSGDRARRDYWYQEIIKADASAGANRTERSRYLAAKAQLSLADVARDAFRAVPLALPLKQSLQVKRHVLESAMSSYKLAASYKFADITTDATFDIGEMYHQLAKDVRVSERPRGLKSEDLEEYNSLLEEQTQPFEAEAIKAHEINAGRARDGIYDEWVKKSFEALAELEPRRYGKTEVTQTIVADAHASGPKPFSAEILNDFAGAVGLMRLGNDEQAELDFQRITSAVPELAAAYINLGILNRKDGHLEEAERAFRGAVEHDAGSAVGWTELGVTQRMHGQFREAVQSYERAVAADPRFAAAYRNLGVLMDLYLADPVRALTAFEHYKQLTGEETPARVWIEEIRERTSRNGVKPASAAGSSSATMRTPPSQPGSSTGGR